MKGGAAIFVKTPGRSPVKSRLAAGIGRADAEEWYRQAAAAVAATVKSVPGLEGYWAVAEPAGRAGQDDGEAEEWTGLPRLEQGPGELGPRMGRVHAALLARHPFAVLLGADAPQLDVAVLEPATAWLAAPEPRLVMGPARDGGFWLLGTNRPVPPAAWSAAPCGRPDTAAGFRAAFAGLGEWRLLPALTDVDHAHDLVPMLAELERLASPCPEQVALGDRTRALLRRMGYA